MGVAYRQATFVVAVNYCLPQPGSRAIEPPRLTYNHAPTSRLHFITKWAPTLTVQMGYYELLKTNCASTVLFPHVSNDISARETSRREVRILHFVGEVISRKLYHLSTTNVMLWCCYEWDAIHLPNKCDSVSYFLLTTPTLIVFYVWLLINISTWHV